MPAWYGYLSLIISIIGPVLYKKRKSIFCFFNNAKYNIPFTWSGDYAGYYEQKPAQIEQEKSDPTDPENQPSVKVELAGSDKDEPAAPAFKYPNEPEIFKAHRIKLAQYSKKLKDREKELEQLERDAIGKIKKAKAASLKRIAQEEQVSRAKIEKEREDLQVYSKAIYDAEYKIMDYAKRIDQRERSLFEEIKQNIEKFNKYNSAPSKNGFQFEEDFSNVLIRNGFINVAVTQRSNDFGADITAEKDGITYVIQCKYYSSAVGIEAVQQVYAAKMHYGTHIAVVATNSVFTQAAKILAKETGVILWDCEKVSQMRNADK